LLALVVTKRLLTDSGLDRLSKEARERVSVILGVASATELVNTMSGSLQRPVWIKALREQGLPEDQVQAICDRMAANYVPWTESTFPGLLGNVIAGRIANRFDFGGTNCVVDAACAGSLAAVHAAMGELAAGTSDLVITGGIDALNDIFMYMCFSKTPAMSPTGDCRPFAADADGTLLGEGIGMFALRRLADAERDGNPIYAVLRGMGSSSDGKAKSIYAPRPEGQARALRRAYDAAGYGPETVELVEAHGTGTVAGDAAEFEALRTVFAGAERGDAQWCALGSVKSQIGHTKAAAGSASLFKAVMALHHKVLPPTIKVKTAHPHLKLEQSPFYLNTATRPWIRGQNHKRRAGISAFGFGGSNFHLTVEEYTGPGQRPARIRTAAHELFLFSGETPAAVTAAAARAAADPALEAAFAAQARASQTAFDPQSACRLAIIAGSAPELAEKAKAAGSPVNHTGRTAPGIFYATGAAPAGKLAFIFPGQGSQALDMGAEVLTALDAARRVWDDLTDIEGADGATLARTVFPPPAFSPEERQRQQARLVETEWAQPAIGATSRVYLTLATAAGLEPHMLCGHSFGELSALHAAGAVDAATFHRLARRRGLRMAEAARKSPGAMLAVKGPAGTLEAAMAMAGPAVVVANRNSPEQIVLAGPLAAIEAAAVLLRQKGLSATRLAVSTAFHSPIVAGAATAFRDDLNAAAIAPPRLPVYGTATAAPYAASVDAVRDALARQIAQPVHFSDQIAAMYRDGARIFVEVGPGRVLTDLVGQCLTGEPHLAVALGAQPQEAWRSLLAGLGQLAVAGVTLDLAFLWDGYDAHPPAAERFSPATVDIDGSNYGKVYPPRAGAAALPRPNPPHRQTPSPAVEQPPAPTLKAPEHAAPGDATGPWLDAIRDIQRHTAEAHQAAQRAIADAHVAYLQASQAMVQDLYATMQGGEARRAPEVAVTPPLTRSLAPELGPSPAVAPSQPAAPTSTLGVDRRAALMAVVADKTGYPVDILRPEMELEADLGIDSIKRVEILAAFRERVPGLPEAALDELAGRRTIGEILEALETAAPAVQANAPAPAPGLAAGVDRRAALMAVVADKTGYPVDILRPEMELEADLGIDPIKRVEILAAFRERVPGLPDAALDKLAGQRTIGDILQALDAAAPAPRGAANATTADRGAMLFAVVAEKTGYPLDILQPSMELEADLGVDSIKRVEILAALRERIPELPEASLENAGGLRTLGEMAAVLNGANAAAAPSRDHAIATAAHDEIVSDAGLARIGLRLRSAPRRGTQRALPSGARVAVIDAGSGWGDDVAAAMTAQGLRVTNALAPDCDGVVYLGGLCADVTLETATLVHRDALLAAKAFAARAAKQGAVFVTVQATGGDFGLSGQTGERAWLGGFSGLIKTARLEWPAAAVKAIDLDLRGHGSRPALAAQIAAEALAGGADLAVGLTADGARVVLEDAPMPLSASTGAGESWRDRVIVVTGGARGITALAAEKLARAWQPRLLVLGRTPLSSENPATAGALTEAALTQAVAALAKADGVQPTPRELSMRVRRILAQREAAANLARLEATGAKVLYRALDIRDRQAVAAVLAEARTQWGPIEALVHGAGVIADKLIADKTQTQFDEVFSTKVDGLHALLAATAADPLRALFVFSSVAARYGNVGQSDYAMANEVMNKVALAEAARRPGCVVRALNWGPWESGMVTPALRRHFEAAGVGLISPDAGAEALVAEFTRGRVEGETDVVLAARVDMVLAARVAGDHLATADIAASD
jgi:acyl transferase domain-containing protein/NAD(P)-dependent dehydrogenase (short-subunit alcohol dehydrogenase family)